MRVRRFLTRYNVDHAFCSILLFFNGIVMNNLKQMTFSFFSQQFNNSFRFDCLNFIGETKPAREVRSDFGCVEETRVISVTF